MKKELIGKFGAIIAVPLLLALPIGLTTVAFSMFYSFQDISLFGPNPAPIKTDEVSLGGLITILGAISFVPGLVLMVISITALNYRAKWVFLYALLISVLMLFIYPIGTFIGVALLIILFITRNKFGSSEVITEQSS